jgi:urate oxidase
MAELGYTRYGKDNIRLYKVQKDPKTGVQSVAEVTVCILLEGDIQTS